LACIRFLFCLKFASLKTTKRANETEERERKRERERERERERKTNIKLARTNDLVFFVIQKFIPALKIIDAGTYILRRKRRVGGWNRKKEREPKERKEKSREETNVRASPQFEEWQRGQ